MQEDDPSTSLSSLTRECEQLRLRVKELETEVERYRTRDEFFAKALSSSSSFARKVREEARHDAELTLRKARSKAQRLLVSADERRVEAENELRRLHRITDQSREALSKFLRETLEQLRLEEEDEHQSAPGAIAEVGGDLGAALRGKVGSPSAPSSAGTMDSEAGA